MQKNYKRLKNLAQTINRSVSVFDSELCNILREDQLEPVKTKVRLAEPLTKHLNNPQYPLLKNLEYDEDIKIRLLKVLVADKYINPLNDDYSSFEPGIKFHRFYHSLLKKRNPKAATAPKPIILKKLKPKKDNSELLTSILEQLTILNDHLRG